MIDSLPVVCDTCGIAHREPAPFCDRCGTPLHVALAAGSAAFENGRFTLQRLLGAGAQRWVYLATDSARGGDVALSISPAADLAHSALQRFRREATTLQGMPPHPHVAQLYETGEWHGFLYTVWEYVEGGSLAKMLHAEPGAVPELGTVLRLCREVCAALAFVHAHGVIHRDLNPNNVLLTEAGHAKLNDFGLVFLTHRSRITRAGEVIGTLPYLAPEQVLTPAVDFVPDPRCDLYALGVMLYELLTGRVPFASEELTSHIAQVINLQPAPPSAFNACVPPRLDALTLRLLAKAPASRPRDAEEVHAVLGAILDALQGPGPSLTTEPVAQSGAASVRAFVGREAEYGALSAQVDTMLGGRGAMALLTGPPGRGKYALAEHVATYAQLRGATVGTAPRAPVAERVRDAASADTSVLGQVLTEIRREVEGGPLVYLIRDADLTDPAWLCALPQLLVELQYAPVLVIVTAFCPGFPTSGTGAALLEQCGRLQGFVHYKLEPLSEEESHALREAHVPAGSAPADIRSRDAFWTQTGGHPTFIVAAASGAVGGAGAETAGTWLAFLSSAAREIARLGAVVGPRFTTDLLRHVSGRSVEVLLCATEELLAAEIVRECPSAVGAYRFTSDMLRDAVYAELTAERRIDLHRRIGNVLGCAASGGPGRQDAVAHYRCAVQLLHDTQSDNREQWRQTLLGLAAAQSQCGLHQEARTSMAWAAVQTADTLDPVSAIEILLDCAPPEQFEFGLVEEAISQLLARALLQVPPDEQTLASRLADRLSRELTPRSSQHNDTLSV